MEKPRLSDLWTWKGTIGRGPYAFWGVLLAILKLDLDRFLVDRLTGRSFSPRSYWAPGDLFGVLPLSPEQARSALPLLAFALPFVWTGIVLTVRRLRAARMPAGAVLLFFVPLVNLLFFVTLCVMPSREEGGRPSRRRLTLLSRIIPRSALGSAAMSFAIVLPLTACLAFLSASTLGSYGWGLFVGLPFFLGLASVLLYGYHEPRSLGSCIVVALLAAAILAAVLIAIAVEGLICIVMAAPIAMALSLFGGFVGWLVQRRPEGGADAGRVVGSLVLFLPGLLGAERWIDPEPALLAVRTSIEVVAPPQAVWRHVIAFAELPPPEERLFRLGVAYPLRAEIQGCGAGAVRRCVFSTGAFVEPIEVWDAPRRLEFSVSAQPPSMRELSPYPGIAPPHLERYLESRRGRFLLEPLEGGRTRLEGTTWYTNRMWPAGYWRLWSDRVIHAIHARVLEHIRLRAEGEGGTR